LAIVKDRATSLTLASIFFNFFLFVLKLAAGLVSNHIAAILASMNMGQTGALPVFFP
jgi:divalent metal cation (Fe/Co/Zn/Cd) transporter